jgi:predicted N-acyltransferase
MSAKIKSAVRVHTAIADIGKTCWDALAGHAAYGGDPFISYDFLQALEESGCFGPSTGWTPCHLSVEDETGETVGVMPLYLKAHSQGEYVFDHSWADAYERAGGRYYPKLQCAVPFSPVSGQRLIVRPGDQALEAEQALLGGALTLCGRMKASSLHVTFLSEGEWSRLGDAGLLQRQDTQYHWENAGYQSFDDFLAALSANRRKTIRRERREAQAGLEIKALSGADLTEAHWDAFYAFYMDTGSRKWGRPYLNRAFFSLLHERLADKVLLVMGFKDGRPIAGALNLMGSHTLYGRNWGTLENIPFLHFELCYYQAIEQAILRGLQRVEAGAQGEHKIARGYLPSKVYSAHYIADPALREPVARYLERERPAVEQEMDYLAAEYSPFRQG